MPQISGSSALAHDQDKHLVRFYEKDDYLVRSIADFLVPALAAGGGAIVVATREHREQLGAELAKAGIDVTSADISERFLSLDAAQALMGFMVDGKPDATLFNDTIGGIVSRMQGNAPLHIFGEMVALLWAEDNVTAALELERLWNDLAGSLVFKLLCAYPMHSFKDDPSSERLKDVCATHSVVIPAESYSSLASHDEQSRSVVVLQQQATAAALETLALREKQTELEEAMRQVEELARLRNDFLAMVVHDIRSPNAIISGFLQVLRENWVSLSHDQIDELLERGLESTQQVEHLVDDLLTTAQLDSGEFSCRREPFDLAEVIYRAVGVIKSGQPNRTLKVTVPADLPQATGDEARQLQILNNLLTNAIKFSPQDSTVFVTADIHDGELITSVRDTGVGIDVSDIPKLFQRFSRLRPAVNLKIKGTGLGLYICKGLVEAQGGRIWVESKVGEGSTFSYTTPSLPR